jgi:hypothetical protein
MNEHPVDDRSATSPSRRTMLLLGAWVAAAVVAGVPAGASDRPSADSGAGRSVSAVNTGPECFAGRSAPPGTSHDTKRP